MAQAFTNTIPINFKWCKCDAVSSVAAYPRSARRPPRDLPGSSIVRRESPSRLIGERAVACFPLPFCRRDHARIYHGLRFGRRVAGANPCELMDLSQLEQEYRAGAVNQTAATSPGIHPEAAVRVWHNSTSPGGLSHLPLRTLLSVHASMVSAFLFNAPSPHGCA